MFCCFAVFLPGRRDGRLWLNLEGFAREGEERDKQASDETFMILCRKIRSLLQLKGRSEADA